MSVVGQIQQCSERDVKDTFPPNDVTVSRAEWGNVVQAHTSSPQRVDPLVIDASGLQAGKELLFINCDDPKVKKLVKEGQIGRLPAETVKVHELKDVDLGGRQTLVFSDAQATTLGLTRGCEFALLQRDKAGNLSAKPAFVELQNDGSTITNFKMQNGTPLGDATVDTPAYTYGTRDRYGRHEYTSDEYNFVRGPDTTPPTVYASDLHLDLSAETGLVTLTADAAFTGKSELLLKNLDTQEEFRVKDETGDGSVRLEGINLRPGDRYTVWVKDRNGVVEKVEDTTFEPSVCKTDATQQKPERLSLRQAQFRTAG